ncbi:class I SAM-dependent methyltransferase [Singulisphaera sp. PoT]|uniref:class I SAM-dependent methyltransferase n=1 Tax=Singulisphaera sp. PoT TaxID=3411797 RepID=UPI003BF5D8FF
MKLLSDEDLERSAVVANCRMNRERNLSGSNGYDKELGFHPLAYLKERGALIGRSPAWLDLCCGSGKALIEAASLIRSEGWAHPPRIVGVDLVGMFLPHLRELKGLKLVEASLRTWQPSEPFDLITCIHGLHYVGDKLGAIARAASWLTAQGLFVASLDPANLKLAESSTSNPIVAELRHSDLEFDPRRRLLRCRGVKSIDLPFRYLGADDQAGPNYTRQPAVNSYYENG